MTSLGSLQLQPEAPGCERPCWSKTNNYSVGGSMYRCRGQDVNVLRNNNNNNNNNNMMYIIAVWNMKRPNKTKLGGKVKFALRGAYHEPIDQ